MKRLFVLVLPVMLLCGPWIQNATAQTGNSTQLSSSRFVGLDSNKPEFPDVAVSATIQQVIPNHVPGTPAGLYLSLGTSQGALHVSVGPYLSQEVQQALAVGEKVQVSGKVQNIRGQNYLLARQLVLGGRQIMIRNDQGSLVRPHSQSRTHAQSLQNGELQ